MIGWLRFLPLEIHLRSESIRIRLRHCVANARLQNVARLCLVLTISVVPLAVRAQQSASPAPARTAPTHTAPAPSSRARTSAASAARSSSPSASATATDASEQLSTLAHALHDHPSPANYDALSHLAQKHAQDALGAHAAL